MNHFEGKDPLSHVLEKKEEIHGNEVPNSLSLFFDTAREMSIFLLFLAFLLNISYSGSIIYLLFAAALALLAWKTGRTCWLAWFRLERLHRLIEQEKYEIEHHREQERDEIVALYSSKGFQGKLLDDVVDTLMADPARLLKVMLEEEMGLTLEAYEHPLKQGLGAFLGGFVSSLILLLLFYFFSLPGIGIGAFCILGVSALVYAKLEKNALIPAFVWNIALAALSFGILYFLIS